MNFGSRSSSLLTKLAYDKLFSVVIFEVKAFHSNLGCFLAILIRYQSSFSTAQEDSGNQRCQNTTSNAGSPTLGIRC